MRGTRVESKLLAALSEMFPELALEIESRRKRDPFKTLVHTMLSQITNRENTLVAYRRLEELVGVEPERLAEAPVELIEEAIRPAGLHKRRARRIKDVAREVLDKFGGDLKSLSRLGTEELRGVLRSLPGVGVKTADVLLLFSYGRPVMPVDTHIARIAKRTGLVDRNAGYEEIRSELESAVPADAMAFAHLALIEFGRRICKPRRPRCEKCPISDVCPRIGVERTRRGGSGRP